MPAPEENNWRKYVPGGPTPMPPENRRRVVIFAVVLFLVGFLVISSLFPSKTVKNVSYSNLLSYAKSQKVISASISNSSGIITGQLSDGTNYTTNGPVPVLSDEVTTLRTDNVSVNFANPSSLLASLLPYLIWILIFGGFMIFLSRQAKGQMNGMMSAALRPNNSTRTGPRPPSPTSRVTSASSRRSAKSWSS